MLQAAILGAIQGITEFFPVSSSAHLILIPYLFGWNEGSKEFKAAFDASLNAGTLFAMIVYFRADLWRYLQGFTRSLARRSIEGDPEARMAWLLAFATVPAAVVGKLWKNVIEDVFRTGYGEMAGLLIVFGFALYLADRFGAKTLALDAITLPVAMAIGCAQALALFPGVSRSGVTMTAGMILGFARPEAARFAFLLATPITLGATLLKFKDLVHLHHLPPDAIGQVLVGIATSGIFGYVAIAALLRFVATRPMTLFLWWRLILGALLIWKLEYGIPH